MASIVLTSIFISVAGFVWGLAGKAASVKKNSPAKNEFYNRVTTFFIILMFLLVIVYQFIK